MKRATVIFAAALLMGGAGDGSAESWYVACDTTSKLVLVTQSVNDTTQEVMAGPLPSRRTAEIWLAESCPGARCDLEGQCAENQPDADEPDGDGWIAGEVSSETAGSGPGGMSTGGGWVAGEVSSETLSGETGGSAVPGGVAGPSGPAGPAGPGDDGLRPLMDNARAAVDACNFHAALLSADHLTNFDPEHPWLQANHTRLRDLAGRQQATENAVWQASSALSNGDLKQARKLAQAAADSAVSCQSRAVSDLLAGIDAAIEHKRQVRSAKNRAAMAALLPGLVDLANTAIAVKYGTPPPPPASSPYGGVGLPSGSAGTGTVAAPDPCAFKYEYRNKWSTEPTCTCPGYRFDVRQFRCGK